MNLKHTVMHTRAVHDETRSVDCICSTDAIDSYEEVVDQANWRLDRFRANPVVLFGHDSREMPIGGAESVRVVNNQLLARIVFATAAANPKAEQVFQAVKEGVLGAVSVGFVPGDIRKEKRGDKDVFVLFNNELLELSVVPIPANPEALIQAKAKGIVGKNVITREYVDWLASKPGDEKLSAEDEEILTRAFEGAESFPAADDVVTPRAPLPVVQPRPARREYGEGEDLAAKVFGDSVVKRRADQHVERKMVPQAGSDLAQEIFGGRPTMVRDITEDLEAAAEQRHQEFEAREPVVTPTMRHAAFVAKLTGGEDLAAKIAGGES